jgi:hypothetical protein
MLEDNPLPVSFPSVERKKVTGAFDGGRITADGGVMLLAAAETALGIADRLAPLITDRRNPLLVTHSMADILRAHAGHCLRLRGCRRPRRPAHRPWLQAGLRAAA